MAKSTDSPRIRLMEATFHLIEQQGYHGTGLNQIVKESGAPKGSLYYYFPGGKEELVAEAIALYGGSLLERIQSVLAETKNPAETIYTIFTNFAHKLDEMGCTRSGSFAAIVLETSNSSERLRKACEQLYDNCSQAYKEMFIAFGFPIDQADRLATWVTTSMEGAVVLCRAKQSSKPLIDIAEELKNYISYLQKTLS
jgi:TetR/AcrR family transcriptional repressor of lmrAB and yxaGH operons